MLATEELLPVGYSIREVEKLLNIPTKTGYRLVKDRKLKAFVDSTGTLKVSPFEIYRYMNQ